MKCCRIEKSTDQVIKPVNLEALTAWSSSVPEDVRRDIHKIAPMLTRLGYDADAYPPNYGEADSFVANNTLLIKSNEQFWQKKAIDAQQLTKQHLPSAQPGVGVSPVAKNSSVPKSETPPR